MKMSMATSTIAVLLTCVLFVAYGVYSTRQLLLKELTLVSKIIGNRAGPALNWGDKESAQESLQDLVLKPSVTVACIYNNKKTLFAGYAGNGHLPCPTLFSEDSATPRWNRLSVYDPIFFLTGQEGTIYIESDIRDIQKEIPKYIGFAVFLTCIIALVAYFISSVYQRFISHPIQELSGVADEVVRKGNYSVTAKQYDDDEIGTLTQSFNKMMCVTHDLKQNLEARVAERTQELANTMTSLEQALKAKSNFLSNMSHEIRTPNHAVLNCSQFARDDLTDIISLLQTHPDGAVSPEEAKKLLMTAQGCMDSVVRICDASKRVGNLLNNILDLSKFGEGKMEMTFATNDLNNIVRTMVQEHEGLCQGRNLKIVFEEAPGDTALVCDKGRMTQVISNLLGNAIKYSEHGTIFLEITGTEMLLNGKAVPAVAFSITDQGVGIPEGELDLIFEKFTESSKTKQQSGGTGIGLAICSEIIRAHQGKIWAENAPGGGSVFRFVVPRKRG